MSSGSQHHTLRREVLIQAPLIEVFKFFSDAGNLNLITPRWLDFKILTALPLSMRKQRRIIYSLKLHGIRFRWETEITEWNPPHAFSDQQLKGPFKSWVHQHLFSETQNGTLMEDIVRYSVPGLFLEPLLHAAIIKTDLNKIFDHRESALLEIFSKASPEKS